MKTKEGIKMFKTIDEKFEDIGFVKMDEDEHGASYQRENTKFRFVQRIYLMRKSSGNHLIQSYDIDLMDEQKIGNTCVGLTMYEAKLCIKKMKQMGWRMRKGGKE